MPRAGGQVAENLIRRLIPAPFAFRVVGKTDSTNLRMHWHRCGHGNQHNLEGRGFIETGQWHEIVWEIRLDRMRVVVDDEVRFEGPGDYSGIESAPSVGPCFGSTVSIRECSIVPLN
jgi:hypothetical protein